jgi:transposase
MERDGSGVSALVGLDGFVVRAQLLDGPSGEWWLAVETTWDRAWCPSCGVRAVGHGRRRVVVRDLPLADRPVVLVWAKRLWRCAEPACPTDTWSEESDHIGPRAVLTERARAEIARRVGPEEHSVARAARDFGVSWHAAMAAVRDHGRPRVDHLARLGAPAAVGLDETSFLAATAERPRLLVTGIVDLDTGRLIDVLPARSAVAVTDWLAAKPQPWLAGIRHVVIDPYQPYATAVARGLPGARLVVDHFHVIRLANVALDEVRRRTQQATTGHRGRKADPRYRIRRWLLASHDRLDPAAFARMLAWLDAGDPEGEVGAAYLAKGTAAGHLPRQQRHRGPPAARGLLPPQHQQRRGRARTPCPHHRPLGDTHPALAPHPAHQRRHRGHQPGHQEHQAARLRVPQPRQLSAPAPPAALRRPMATSTSRINTTPPTTHQRVEPDSHRGVRRLVWVDADDHCHEFLPGLVDGSARALLLQIVGARSSFELSPASRMGPPESVERQEHGTTPAPVMGPPQRQ